MTRPIDLPDPQDVEPWRGPRRSLSAIQEALSASLEDLKVAAHGFGLRSDHPEMRFLQSQIAVQSAISNLVGTFAKTVTEASDAALQAEQAVKWRLDALEKESEKLVKATINDVGKQISDESVKWNIIREHKWNQTQNWIRVTVLTCVVLVMLLTGFIIRFAIDKTAVLGLVDCEDAPLLVTGSNGSFLACPLSDLASPDTVNELNGEFIHPSQ